MSKSEPIQQNRARFVPFTARLMAAMRAKETARADCLFNDSFAEQLAGKAAFAFLEEKLFFQQMSDRFDPLHIL